MTGKVIGYVRVSTVDQCVDRQLAEVECHKKFVEKASAATTKRPVLEAMIDYVRDDDVVVVHSLDRLARNLKDLKTVVDTLVQKGVTVRFLKENIEFTPKGIASATSTLLLHLLGAFAEFEHAFIMERQREGIAKAKAAGKFKGGTRKIFTEDLKALPELIKSGISKDRISEALGISRSTLYKYLKEIGFEHKGTFGHKHKKIIEEITGGNKKTKDGENIPVSEVQTGDSKEIYQPEVLHTV